MKNMNYDSNPGSGEASKLIVALLRAVVPAKRPRKPLRKRLRPKPRQLCFWRSN